MRITKKLLRARSLRTVIAFSGLRNQAALHRQRCTNSQVARQGCIYPMTSLVNSYLTDLLLSSFLAPIFTVVFDRKTFTRLFSPAFGSRNRIMPSRPNPTILLVILQLGRIASHRPIALSQSLHTSLVSELSFCEGVRARDGSLRDGA